MTGKGKTGARNRNFPGRSLQEALSIPRAIQDQASGMPTLRVTLGQLVGKSPGSSVFYELVMASRAYGLTTGGANAQEFGLTELGRQATGADEVAQQQALRQAVLNIPPFRAFLDVHGTKKVPAPAAFRDFLVRNAGVPLERAEECMERILADARHVGFITHVQSSGDWFNVNAAAFPNATTMPQDGREFPEERVASAEDGNHQEDDAGRLPILPSNGLPTERSRSNPLSGNKKVFIAHGKNRVPLEQLKKMLDHFKVLYAVAIDDTNRGRPVSAKVANLMREECSSAIFIFTADNRFLAEDENGDMTVELWRPSENVVYELGAASILYDNRIVIFKEKRVVFPSDFSDLGYISFEEDQLSLQMLELMDELVDLDILEIRAKG